MLGGAVAFFWTFYSKSDSEFSQWLYSQNAYGTYLKAYLTAIFIYLILSILLILTKQINNEKLALTTLWFLVLGIINAYSFIKKRNRPTNA